MPSPQHHSVKQSTPCVCPLPPPQLPHASGMNRHCRCQASALVPSPKHHSVKQSTPCVCPLPPPQLPHASGLRHRHSQASAPGAFPKVPQLQAEHTLCVPSATAASPTCKRTETPPLSGECRWCLLHSTTTSSRAHLVCALCHRRISNMQADWAPCPSQASAPVVPLYSTTTSSRAHLVCALWHRRTSNMQAD